MIRSAASSGMTRVVSMRTSGLVGASSGESTPVKLKISPRCERRSDSLAGGQDSAWQSRGDRHPYPLHGAPRAASDPTTTDLGWPIRREQGQYLDVDSHSRRRPPP